MSLLKLLKAEIPAKDVEVIKNDFLEIILTLQDSKAQTEDVICLVQLYTDYSIQYLDRVARTLVQESSMRETMNLMNSYLAEVIKDAELHYFNKEEGYSIIDKSVADAIDNEGVLKYNDIKDIITVIEESYVELEEVPEA
jgi:hypothetical protein